VLLTFLKMPEHRMKDNIVKAYYNRDTEQCGNKRGKNMRWLFWIAKYQSQFRYNTSIVPVDELSKTLLPYRLSLYSVAWLKKSW